MNIIEIRNLKKCYGKEEVLNINTFSFCFGKSYLIYGSNGSGKSTLLKIIVGLIKESDGEITKNYKNISYVPERLIYPDFLTVGTFLEMICKVIGKRINKSEIENVCRTYNINPHKQIYKLSKGMKQKVLIIQAILSDNELFIFDEALNGLDYKTQDQFISLIKTLTNMGKTVIIATHFAKFFENVVDYIVYLDNGDLRLEENSKTY